MWICFQTSFLKRGNSIWNTYSYNKLADAFAKQEDISSKDALTAATQEGLLNALNDEEVVTLTTAQKKIKGALVDVAKGAVEGVAAAISNTSDSVVESSVASTLETALDNATSVVDTAVNLSSNPTLNSVEDLLSQIIHLVQV